MSTNIKSSKPNSAVGRQSPRCNKTSETDFVAKEAADAKSAPLESVANLKTSAANSLDIRQWARRYPLRTAGAAVLAGFVAAAVLKKGGSPAAKTGDTEPGTSGANREQAPPVAGERAAGESSAAKRIVGVDYHRALDVLKTAAQTFLMNAIRPPQDAELSEAEEEDGTAGDRQ